VRLRRKLSPRRAQKLSLRPFLLGAPVRLIRTPYKVSGYRQIAFRPREASPRKITVCGLTAAPTRSPSSVPLQRLEVVRRVGEEEHSVLLGVEIKIHRSLVLLSQAQMMRIHLKAR